MRLPPRVDNPLTTLCLTAALSVAFVVVLLARRDWNPTSFVQVGSLAASRDSHPPGFVVLEGVVGYDGRYFYQLALHPFAPPRQGMSIRLDPPAYRQQRIFYPMLVHFASLGKMDLVPWGLIAVNLAALCLLGYLGGVYAHLLGLPALWGIVLPLHVGFVTTLSRDLSEIVECTLVIAGLLAYRRQRFWATGVLLSLAVLTKEPALLAAAGIGLADLIINRRVSRGTWITAGLPLLVYLSWHLWLIAYWGADSLNLGGSNQGWPFSGYWNALSWGIWHWHWPWALFCLQLTVMVAAVLLVPSRTRATVSERWAWALYALLIFSLSTEVWADNHAFVRASSELSLLSAIILLGAELPRVRWLLVMNVLLCIAAASQVV